MAPFKPVQLFPFDQPSFKAAGFTLTIDQLKRFAARHYKTGKELQDVTAFTSFMSLCERNNFGSLYNMAIPSGVDVPRAYFENGFYRCYFLPLNFQVLIEPETLQNFQEIPFNPNNAEVRRAIEWFGGYGCTPEELTSSWKTFSEWSFYGHHEYELDKGGSLCNVKYCGYPIQTSPFKPAQLFPFDQPPFKAGGFTFTIDQLRKFATRHYRGNRAGNELQDATAFASFESLCERNNVGNLHDIAIPKGVDVPGAYFEDGFYRCCFLAVHFEPVTVPETLQNFQAIQFDPNDEGMKRKIEWLRGYGCTLDELKSRWKTFSEWSFSGHRECESKDNDSNK